MYKTLHVVNGQMRMRKFGNIGFEVFLNNNKKIFVLKSVQDTEDVVFVYEDISRLRLSIKK